MQNEIAEPLPAQSGNGVRAAEPRSSGRVPATKHLRPSRVVLLLVGALLINAGIVLGAFPRLSSLSPAYNVTFGDLYPDIAKNLDEGNGYRVEANMSETMLREPGYPLLLAAVFKVAGFGLEQARITCVVLAFGAALLLMWLARKITGDAITALAAALLFLLYPGIIVAEARAGIELPCIFTMLVFMLALHDAVEKNSRWRYGAAGLLLGVAVLVRSEVLFFPALLLVYLLLAAKSWAERRKIVQGIALLAAGTAVAMSPWVIRNYRLVHSFVPTTTVAGLATQAGLYSCENSLPGEPFYLADGEAGLRRKEIATQLGLQFAGPYFQIFYTPQDELHFYRTLLSGVSAEYRSHPEVLASCAARNFVFNFWFLGKTEKSVLLNVLVQAPLLALAFAGVVVLWKRGSLDKAGIILLYILYIPAIHAPTVAEARYSMFVVPFLIVFAAVFLSWARRGFRERRSSPRGNLAITEGAPFAA